jgi:hypothetical protein
MGRANGAERCGATHPHSGGDPSQFLAIIGG